MKAKRLLGYGFFPSDLIPPFTSEGLFNHFEGIDRRVATYNPRGTAKSLHLSMPKNNRYRRKFSIPNPFYQYKLSKTIELNWNDIKSILSLNHNALSTPVVSRKDTTRSLVPKENFSEISTLKIMNSVGKKYMVYADVSRYYGTIYTHSIPWAVHGKDVAKNNHSDSLYGNYIDKCVRNSQDGQTLGIPIGPDTSFLISELISSRVDEMLSAELDSAISRFRYVDDYYFFCENLSQTEQVLSKVAKVFSEFELEMNPEKTTVMELPVKFESDWVSDLRLYRFSYNRNKQKLDIINYFSTVFTYAETYKNDNVIKYGIKRIRNKKFHKDNWIIYERLLLQAMHYEPTSIQIALEIFLKYETEGYKLEKNQIKKTIYAIVDDNIVHNNAYEILWVLWLAKSLGVKISKPYAQSLLGMDNPLVAIVIIDMINNNLVSPNLDFSEWREYENADSLMSEYWMYSYEAYVQGFKDTDERYVNQNQFFKALESECIRFYDTNLQVHVNSFEEFDDELQIKTIKSIQEVNRRLKAIEEARIEGDTELEENLVIELIEKSEANEKLMNWLEYY